MSAPRAVATLSTGTTRDCFSPRFNPDHPRWYSLRAEAYDTSLVALMSPPVEAGPDRATERSFLTRLAADPPDLLVVDLGADSRPGTVEETEEHLARWRDAFDRFAAYVAEHCPGTRVVLHRSADTGDAVLGHLEDHAVATTDWDVIDLRGEGYVPDRRHPPGPFRIEYPADYYRRFLAELHAIDLRMRLGADLADRVAVVAAASRERARNQAAFLDGAYAEQRDLIAGLERQGPLRAFRRARARRSAHRAAGR